MMSNIYDRKSERLQTTDEYGKRVYIHPEDLKGTWKSRRQYFYWFLILLYLVLPWIYINGEQWVLIDITRREFTFFGFRFYGHDTPYLIFFLLGFPFLMAFLTSIFGRVWCGWACPQTVFIEAIFRKIEVLIEGASRTRMRLDKANISFEKIWKKSLKWFLFTIVSLHITHSFLGYFVGTRHLLAISMQSPLENWPLFITMLVISGILLFDFGWFREQFCIIMCPYGRMQSVMMDSDSITVGYDYGRGEPRRAPGLSRENEGDCVNCFQCVKVCPTGIDIRNGMQLECIACTACIDACDNIMDRLKRPRGLIRYTTENALEGRLSHPFRFRTFLYGLVLIVLFGVSTLFLSHKDDLRAVLVRGRGETFRIEKDLVVNHFKVSLYYQNTVTKKVYFKLPPKYRDLGIKLIAPMNPYTLKGRGKQKTHFFLKAPRSLFRGGSLPIAIIFYDKNDEGEEIELLKREVKLVGPYTSNSR